MIRPVSSQLADFLRLGPTPASSDEVGCSAVNRQAVGSNPARGANLFFLSELSCARTFGRLPNGGRVLPLLSRLHEAVKKAGTAVTVSEL
jgi:hypothetical protein